MYVLNITTSVSLLAVLSVFISAEASEMKLRIGYNDNSSYPHFLGTGERPADPPGLSLDILNHIAEELEFGIEYKRRPGRRILHELKANKLDAAFIFSFKPERQEFGVYPIEDGKPDSSKRLTVLSYVLYKNKSSKLDWNGKKFDNLNGTIGANAGYSIVADLRKKGVLIEEAKSSRNNFSKLESGRIAGVADQEIVADAYLRTNRLNNIVKVSPPIATKDYYLIFSHEFSNKNQALRDRIWQMISEQRDELTKKFIPVYLNDGNF